MRHLGLMLCGLLAACASATPSQKEASASALSALAQECDKRSVLALCDSGQCELFWCRAVAPHLTSGQSLRSPGAGELPLPGALSLNTRTTNPRFQAAPSLSGAVIQTQSTSQLEAPSVEGLRVFKGRDVVQQLVHLQKPGEVAAWWASEPKAHPGQWRHPLSHWEREYLRAMMAPTVPEALRMHPPAEHDFENRRRIVAHYVLTHPATVRLHLGLYGLVRDSNPLHFALERGWQVGRGREMFTQKDVSRLGSAAEFFAALAVGVAVEKALSLSHPLAGSTRAAPYLTPEVERTFIEAVRLRAAHMAERLSLKERGPVLTGVLDTRTGRTFFGINQELRPSNLHPLLQRRLENYLAASSGTTPARAGVPGAHSEIVALSRALYEREAVMGRPITPHELSEFVLHNRSLRGPSKLVGIPPPCTNCEAILPPETRVLP